MERTFSPARCIAGIGAALAAFGLTAATSAAAFEVPLAVTEPLGIARRSEPISGGVPLPAGRFAKDQPFVLADERGQEIPCQVLPLVVERDGTLRWVLVDFQDDLAAGETKRYRLRPGTPSKRPAAAVQVRQSADEVVIDTGRMTLRLSKTRPFAVFDRVEVGGRTAAVGKEASYTQLAGRSGWNDDAAWQERKLTAGPPDSLAVRYAGPLRATIEVEGRFADDPAAAGYKAWITTWAGSSRALVKYKLCNSNPRQYTAILVKQSQIELELPSAGAKTLLGAAVPVFTEGDAWMHQGLHLHHTWQDIAGAVKVGSGANVHSAEGGPDARPAGWIADDGAAPVFALDRLFASNPARRIERRGGRLVLSGIAPRFDGPKDAKFQQDRRVGQPWHAEGFWLYDCSHHSSEYLFDFAAPAGAEALDALARTAQARLWAVPPGEYFRDCDALGFGPFGTLEDEKEAYRRWGWRFDERHLPTAPAPPPGAHVDWEDNHYESEADSVQGLLLMYLRTGHRGWFDLAEAWARYHMDLQAWRTDGWRWKDGAIWFPSGGPQGNRRTRDAWNFAWGPDWGDRQNDPDCRDLWRQCRAKSCYCHFYGCGLADWYCLTGDPDALAAAIDNVEQKDNEFRVARGFVPGEKGIDCIRGFGRGFEVMVRVLQADPQNDFLRDLCRFSAEVLWRSPMLDERGFHPSQIGAGFSGMEARLLSPPIQQWMNQRGISVSVVDGKVDTLTKDGKTWPVVCFGGTWQHLYVQNGADLYARYFDDDDMRDFVIAFAKMSERYMLSPKCRQTWYYTYFDVPDRGMVFDPWAFEHTDTTDGEGCVHSGWYTRFFPDACARGFAWTGEASLLDAGRDFWYFGSKRGYQTKGLSGAADEVGMFAGHHPPKDDQVLSVSRMFYEAAHPRIDALPPEAVADLSVRRLGDGRAEVRFTAPADRGGGRVARYQVKASPLPIAPYEQWDIARDDGVRCNWWRAVNLAGEPAPAAAGKAERFLVTGVPEGGRVYFAIRAFDDSNNRSAMSNLAEATAE